MNVFQLTLQQFKNFKPNIMVYIMIPLIAIRSFISGNELFLTGLCMAFLPFFSQTRSLTCSEEDVSEHKDMLSRYLMSYILMSFGLICLKVITNLGKTYCPIYTVNPFEHECFMMLFLCNIFFISIVVPTTFSLTMIQRYMVGLIVCMGEIGVMLMIRYLLVVLGLDFSPSSSPFYWLLMITFPTLSLLLSKINALLEHKH